ncbi:MULTISPECIES: AAA family ATPase [unclassified Sulfitobacter]|uniref:AAA family ATPase n=1 Tax=unclassified Sulfitobacter TaxID=196795 RepID=UPI000AD47734|nr:MULTISPECIES: AAA family ATPase [unclassified Sulfitobacter]
MERVTRSELAQVIAEKSRDKARFVVAIAGAPGSGKSTLATELAAELEQATVLPMDGFHRDNEELIALGRLHRKGAPDTFDADGFVGLVRRLRQSKSLTYPTFDRALDKTVPNGGSLQRETRIVLVEGNYLLLDIPPWAALADLFDLTVWLDEDRETLKTRLVQRWRYQGFSEAEALAQALGNDMLNAEFAIEHSRLPGVVVVSD